MCNLSLGVEERAMEKARKENTTEIIKKYILIGDNNNPEFIDFIKLSFSSKFIPVNIIDTIGLEPDGHCAINVGDKPIECSLNG